MQIQNKRIIQRSLAAVLTLIFVVISVAPSHAAADPYKKYKRIIRADRIFNLRDFGGYETKNGNKVREGVLYRSSQISFATKADMKMLRDRLGVATVIDVRCKNDWKYCPNKTIKGIKTKRIQLSRRLVPGKHSVRYKYRKMRRTAKYSSRATFMRRSASNCVKAPRWYITDIALSRHGRGKLAKVFRVLLKEGPKTTSDGSTNAENDRGILIHCTHGKDRTGVASALILLALGVDEKTVIRDYKLTNTLLKYHYRSKYSRGSIGVKESHIRYTLKRIRKKYGSYEKYFTKGLKLKKSELRKLRKMYTE